MQQDIESTCQFSDWLNATQNGQLAAESLKTRRICALFVSTLQNHLTTKSHLYCHNQPSCTLFFMLCQARISFCLVNEQDLSLLTSYALNLLWRIACFLDDIRKVRNETLSFRTDLQDHVVGPWSIKQWIMIFTSKLFKNLTWTLNSDQFMAFRRCFFIFYHLRCKL